MKERSAFYSVLSRLQSGRFFLKISKEIGKAWRKSLTRVSHARRVCEAREKKF